MIRSNGYCLFTTILLSVVAFAGNMASVPLFFGVDLIFGSVAVILAAMLLGTIPAVIVALVGSFYTLMLWGHPYAMVIFATEALAVALLYRHKGLNPVIADAAFWLLLGAPLVFVFYSTVMDMPPEAVKTILFKQPLNGVLNALIASLLILVTQLTGAARGILSHKGVKTQEILFHALFSLVFIAGAAPIIYEAHAQLWGEQERISKQLGEDNLRLATHLNDRQLEYHRYWTTRNREALAQALLVGERRVLLRTGTLKSLSDEGQLRRIDEHLSAWLPPGEMSLMQRWRQGRYVYRTPVDKSTDITAIVSEVPAGPVIKAVQQKYITLFTVLTLVLFLGMIATTALSRWLTAPIRALTRASETLDDRIAAQETIQLPRSSIVEFNHLSETLAAMSKRLSDSVAQLHQSRAAIQEQVEQRTHELDETARLLRSVLEAATEFGIIATNLQGRIILFNSGAEKLLGYSVDDLDEDDTPALFHAPEDIPDPGPDNASAHSQDVFSRIVARATENGLDAREWTFIRKDGERIPVWLTITPTRSESGQLTGYLGIAEDITERKRLDRMKNEFISTVSHELRTPLTSIAGALGLMTQGATGDLPAKAQKMADVAHRNTDQLSALVNDLLDMEKLVSGKIRMNLGREDIRGIARETLDNHTAFADQRRVTLAVNEPEAPLYASVDPQRLNQALSNLLSNAIKFSPAGSRVWIDFTSDSAGIALRVHDAGPGIPEHFRDRIFERFSQVNTSDNRQQPGTGLGLAITKELMTQMGGDAGFESVEGHGSTFWLWLPKQ
ncbi:MULTISPECIES: ATP-binding protein [Halomonadaceae]|uniref:histidine kinase n=1 Tax=Vreelandella halophila TaxID=86177 RepID=A0A9X5B5S3_9GAMM|nr:MULTISPECIES: ATP-binding protein [Halomonas]MYL27881.1 PAS domain S-box protein [Halomonas utahensis]MYL75007.1 PAS domain S-box protein [Halomonas sp. 22501_18_FS]